MNYKLVTEYFTSAAFIIVLTLGVLGKEVEICNRTGIVKKSWEEQKREEIVSVFGDLTQYDIICMHPETLLVIAIKNYNEKEIPAFKTFYWRHGQRKEDLQSENISIKEFNLISNSVDALINTGKSNKPEKHSEKNNKDYAHPDRVLIFKRYKNVDVWDWHCVSIRSNSKNKNFVLIGSILKLFNNVPSPDEVNDFFRQ